MNQSLVLFIVVSLFNVICCAQYCSHDCTLRVVVVEMEPMLYYDADLEGNERFSGYAVDVLFDILDYIDQNISVEYYLSPDGQFGQYLDGDWTGTIGEILDGNADLGGTPQPATAEQNEVVDFTFPIIASQLRILVMKDSSVDLFSFLKPFNAGLWCLIVVATFVVGISVWLLDRFSPYGHRNSVNEAENKIFTAEGALVNSINIALGSSSVPAKNWASRLVIFGFLFFALIMTSAYTANLTATLTVTHLSSGVDTLQDLRQNSLPFGVMNGSAACYFFHLEQNTGALSNMLEYQDVESAISALRNGDLCAVVFGSAILDYIVTQPPCDIIEVGDSLTNSFYSLPFPKSSPLTSSFSQAIISLNEEGTLDSLYAKWYTDQSRCDQSTTSLGFTRLTISNFGGLFLLLAFFVCVGTISLFLELFWHLKGKYILQKRDKASSEPGAQMESTYQMYQPPEEPKVAT